MATFWQDVRYAFRALLKNPGFSAVAVITLALGIGANTAVFSVINAVLLRPLPYEEPDRLALLWTNFGVDLPQNWISGPEFVEMREFSTAFEDIGIVVPFSVTITGDGEPVQVGAAGASANFFDVLKVNAHRGRLFQPGDDLPGADLAAVLSHGFWNRRYGAADILEKTIQVNGQAYTVIGVLPEDFAILHPDAQFPKEIDVWAPLAPTFGAFFGVNEYSRMPRGNHGLRGFGRLKPGVTPAQAQQDMTAVAARIKEKSPDYYDFEGWGITVIPLHEDLVEEVRTVLLVLMGAVGFVLLIACVNVANLMLARSAAREREMAVRTALGAGRGRLVRQLLTESVVLASIGGLLGLATAFLLVRALSLLVPADVPRGDEVSVDGFVLLFTLLASIGTGVVFGLAPALHSLKENVVESLKEGGRGVGGAGGNLSRAVLVVAEIALAAVLLVGAGLMLRSFTQLLSANPGYRSNDILTFRVSLPSTRYDDAQRITGFFDRLLERTASLPGVKSVGAISQLPLSGQAMSGTTRVRESQTVPEDKRAWEVDRRVITPGYFEAMGVRLVKGRFFGPQDHAEAPLTAIVDETFVRHFWPNEEPIGKHISINSNEAGRVWREVVGVVSHSKHSNLRSEGREQAYFPLTQFPFNNLYVAVRTGSDPVALAASVRREVLALDPDQPVADIRTMESRVEAALAQPKFTVWLLAGFALVALSLAAVGIYGVISYSVSRRRSEFGIRMALGADAAAVRLLVLKQGLVLAALGLAAGAAAALVLARLMESILYGVKPGDPSTYLATTGLLALVAVLACYLPAARATRVNPVEVLHAE